MQKVVMGQIPPESISSVEKLAEDGQQSWMEWLVGDAYTSAWRSIVQPPRSEYTLEDLGPKEFTIHGDYFQRDDLQLTSLQGETLECSHYYPKSSPGLMRPCVVYLHGHGSCRLEALEVARALLPRDISVFCFDFSGSGMSEGKYVSLGLQEEKNLVVVLRHLRKTGRVSSIALWGHSMGASTAILRAAKDHRLSACVLDSPFANLRALADEIIKQRSSLPQFMTDMMVESIRSEILQHAGFDLQEVVPLSSAPKATCPAFFAAALDDDLIPPQHSQTLQLAWGGRSCFRGFTGGHNGVRPEWFMHEVAEFLVQHLHTWISDFEVMPLHMDHVSSGKPVSFTKVPPHFCAATDEAAASPKLARCGAPEAIAEETTAESQAWPVAQDVASDCATVEGAAVSKVIAKWRERACRSEIAASIVERDSPSRNSH